MVKRPSAGQTTCSYNNTVIVEPRKRGKTSIRVTPICLVGSEKKKRQQGKDVASRLPCPSELHGSSILGIRECRNHLLGGGKRHTSRQSEPSSYCFGWPFRCVWEKISFPGRARLYRRPTIHLSCPVCLVEFMWFQGMSMVRCNTR